MKSAGSMRARGRSAEFKGERVPLLEEVFEAVGQRVLINVEIKGMSLRGNGLEAKVAALIAEARPDRSRDHLVVQSVRPAARQTHRSAPGVRLDRTRPICRSILRDAWLAPLIPDLDARHPHHSQVNQAVVDQFHARGLVVNVWTVNQAGDRCAR